MRLVRKGTNPIKLPFAIKSSERILAAWSNEVRTCLQQLRDQILTVSGGHNGGGGSGGHPFKIRVIDGDMSVDYGQLYVTRVYNDTGARPFIACEPATIEINGGELRNNPDGGTVGTIALSASNTYGVWIKAGWTFPGSFDKTSGITGDFVDWNNYSFAFAAEVVTSTTNITGGNTAGIIAGDSYTTYVFVGRVEVDGSGGATISQYLRSDLALPSITLPGDIISSDSPNEIYNGTDGGLIVDP